MLKKTSWNPYSSSGSTRAIKRPLKGKKGCSALKQLRPLSPLLGAPKEVLRKCQFLIKTRGHDDHFFQRIHTIRRTQRGMAWMLSLFWPHELGVPSPQIKKRAVDNWSVNMPEERVLNVSPCALSPPGPIPGPDNNTAASRHRGLALTINAMNKSHKRVGECFILGETIPCFTLQGFFLCWNKVAFNEI